MYLFLCIPVLRIANDGSRQRRLRGQIIPLSPKYEIRKYNVSRQSSSTIVTSEVTCMHTPILEESTDNYCCACSFETDCMKTYDVIQVKWNQGNHRLEHEMSLCVHGSLIIFYNALHKICLIFDDKLLKLIYEYKYLYLWTVN